jgi:hypothetical protein
MSLLLALCNAAAARLRRQHSIPASLRKDISLALCRLTGAKLRLLCPFVEDSCTSSCGLYTPKEMHSRRYVHQTAHIGKVPKQEAAPVVLHKLISHSNTSGFGLVKKALPVAPAELVVDVSRLGCVASQL